MIIKSICIFYYPSLRDEFSVNSKCWRRVESARARLTRGRKRMDVRKLEVA